MLGPVNTEAVHNRKGNREDSRIWALHDAILRRNGGTWADPPDTVCWTDSDRAERDGIVASHMQEPLWGFKDPRTLLLFDFWREILPDAMLIGTFRHPRLVAESLVRREGRDVEPWLGLWARYNSELLALHAARPFPIIRFDTDEVQYRRSLLIAMQWLGIALVGQPSFFAPELRHNVVPQPPQPPPPVMALYDTLCHIAIDPDSPAAAVAQRS